MNLDNFPETLTLFIPHRHLTSINQDGFIESMVKKVKNAYKEDGWIPPMLRLKHCSSYVTPLSQLTSRLQLKYSMDVQHRVLFFQDHSGRSIYTRSTRGLLSCKRNRRSSLTEPTEPEICVPWRWKNVSSSSRTNKPRAPSNGQQVLWLSYFECGHSYMIRGQNGRVYRKESSSFKAHLSWRHLLSRPSRWRKGTNSRQRQFLSRPFGSFQDHPGPIRVLQQQSELHRWWSRLYGHPGPWCLMDPRHVKHPRHHQQCHPPRCHSPRSPSFSQPASLPSRESSVEPSSEDSSPEGRKRHQSEPAFIRPHNIDQGLTPEPFQHSWLKHHLWTPTDYSDRPKPKLKEKSSHISEFIFKTIWLISRPSCVTIDLHGTVLSLHRPPMDNLQDHQKWLNYKLFDTKEDRWQRRWSRQPHPSSSSSSFCVHNCFMHYSDTKISFQDHLKWHSLSSIRANMSPIRTIFSCYNSMLAPLRHRHLIFCQF